MPQVCACLGLQDRSLGDVTGQWISLGQNNSACQAFLLVTVTGYYVGHPNCLSKYGEI